ncbi:MAG: hypothetical protein JJLCMIEE_01224 [Acidimicrobiales bacterium]|nr:MAG: PaaI family thioesterase [Actinomycetota bacterium]MBV6508164.1 hypothetical protein [Acidimicrobiales bacterium]RIK08181.1 MAG: hypothetical protein DCC48_02060 [Acidobacteriota bacterium]
MPYRADQFDPLPAEVRELWAEFGNWNRTYFPTHLGIRLEELRRDYARMRLPYRPELEQPAGVMHGGAIASLIDTVVVPAIGSHYDEFRPLLTVDMQVRYLASISGEDAVAEGWIAKRGSSIVFCDAEVSTPSGTLVATGTLVYKIGRLGG